MTSKQAAWRVACARLVPLYTDMRSAKNLMMQRIRPPLRTPPLLVPAASRAGYVAPAGLRARMARLTGTGRSPILATCSMTSPALMNALSRSGSG